MTTIDSGATLPLPNPSMPPGWLRRRRLAQRAAAVAYRLGLRRSGIVRGAVLALCHGPSQEFLTQLMNDLGVGRAPFEVTSIPGAAVFEVPCQPGAERATLTHDRTGMGTRRRHPR